ncbi:hypothetical protein Tco_1178031 [Tanacetum coccineum]
MGHPHDHQFMCKVLFQPISLPINRWQGLQVIRDFAIQHTSPKLFDPQKCYVVDVGYPNYRGYLAPYKGIDIHYHLPDFHRGRTTAIRAPIGYKETFNYAHSSLRNVIERNFWSMEG